MKDLWHLGWILDRPAVDHRVKYGYTTRILKQWMIWMSGWGMSYIIFMFRRCECRSYPRLMILGDLPTEFCAFERRTGLVIRDLVSGHHFKPLNPKPSWLSPFPSGISCINLEHFAWSAWKCFMPRDILFVEMIWDDQIGCLCEAFLAKESCAQGWQSRVRILRDTRLQEAKRHEDMLNKLEGRMASGRMRLLNF